MIPGFADFHFVLRACCVIFSGEEDVVGDVDDGECAAGMVAEVWSCIVEVASVVEGDAAGWQFYGFRFGDCVSAFFHFLDDAFALNGQAHAFLFAEFVASGDEAHAAVFSVNVVYCDPGRECARAIHARPVWEVLVPVGFSAFDAGWFYECMVVIDADLFGLR